MTLSLLLFKLLSVLGLSFVLATPQATCVTPEETAKHAFAPPPSGVRGLRVAWSPTLGYAPVDPEVRTLCEQAARVFADELGCAVEEPVQDKREGVSPPDGSSRSAAPSGGDASADDSDDGISNGI